jgi:hypothetical protein
MCRLPRVSSLLYAFVLSWAPGLWGQGVSSHSTKVVIESGTPVKLQLAQTISSARARENDPLEFTVTEDVTVEGYPVIRAGAKAEGTVVEVRGGRPLGIGGSVVISLNSSELSTGQDIQLAARKEFRGSTHTIRMAMMMAVTAAVYMPAAPAFLLSTGPRSTVLKGTTVVAYTKNDVSVDVNELRSGRGNGSELDEMMRLLPSRVMNGQGREGDALNLVFLASENDLQEAFRRAGWLKADRSRATIIWRLLWQRGHYTKLPMDKLYVFGRAQDYSYVLPDPKSIVARRHHLRIWKTDRMVDGFPLWVGAATHDVSIQLVKHKLRLFHRIDPNVDAERDFIAEQLSGTEQIAHKAYIRCADPVLSAQTATGQVYHSDGRILFLQLEGGVAPMDRPTDIAAETN